MKLRLYALKPPKLSISIGTVSSSVCPENTLTRSVEITV